MRGFFLAATRSAESAPSATLFGPRTTQELYNKICTRNYQGLTSRLMEYSGCHGGMFEPSFKHAMRTLYP